MSDLDDEKETKEVRQTGTSENKDKSYESGVKSLEERETE